MSLRRDCPCDIDGICPYDAQYSSDCEWWCSSESDDYPYIEVVDIKEE